MFAPFSRPLTTSCSGCASLLLFLLLILLPWPAHADRALIVGVSHYKSSYAPTLPGIDLDVGNARSIISSFKVEPPPDQMRVLMDKDATADAIKEGIKWALGAGPAERVIIYFSGHGSQVLGDDGVKHSSLVAHDYAPSGGGRATGVVPGNWIGDALHQSHAGYVLLLVDACESGKITKAFTWDDSLKEAWTDGDGLTAKSITPKYVTTPGAEDAPTQSFKDIGGAMPPSPSKEKGGVRWVALSAVQDNQYAPASSIGSPFTLALHRTVTREDPRVLTPRQLRDKTTDQLRGLGVTVDPSPHGVNPQVWGSYQELLQELLVSVEEPPHTRPHPAPPATPGEHWSLLQQMVANSDAAMVSISSPRRDYKVGELLTLTLTLKRGGYLTLINVDQNDDAELLVPSRVLSSQLRLDAGTYTLPAYLTSLAPMPIRYRADSPGDILMVAIVSPQPIATIQAGGRVDAQTIRSLFSHSTCDPGRRCRLFVAEAADADGHASQVTRREAVSLHLVIR